MQRKTFGPRYHPKAESLTALWGHTSALSHKLSIAASPPMPVIAASQSLCQLAPPLESLPCTYNTSAPCLFVLFSCKTPLLIASQLGAVGSSLGLLEARLSGAEPVGLLMPASSTAASPVMLQPVNMASHRQRLSTSDCKPGMDKTGSDYELEAQTHCQ